MACNRFNKKVFAVLLEKAKGERSWRKFAADCGISYIQMLKLSKGEQENSPRSGLIAKIGERSENGIGTEDFYFAAGFEPEAKRSSATSDSLGERFCSLSPARRKAVEDFVDFLYSKEQLKKKSKEKNEGKGDK